MLASPISSSKTATAAAAAAVSASSSSSSSSGTKRKSADLIQEGAARGDKRSKDTPASEIISAAIQHMEGLPSWLSKLTFRPDVTDASRIPEAERTTTLVLIVQPNGRDAPYIKAVDAATAVALMPRLAAAALDKSKRTPYVEATLVQLAPGKVGSFSKWTRTGSLNANLPADEHHPKYTHDSITSASRSLNLSCEAIEGAPVDPETGYNQLLYDQVRKLDEWNNLFFENAFRHTAIREYVQRAYGSALENKAREMVSDFGDATPSKSEPTKVKEARAMLSGGRVPGWVIAKVLREKMHPVLRASSDEAYAPTMGLRESVVSELSDREKERMRKGVQGSMRGAHALPPDTAPHMEPLKDTHKLTYAPIMRAVPGKPGLYQRLPLRKHHIDRCAIIAPAVRITFGLSQVHNGLQKRPDLIRLLHVPLPYAGEARVAAAAKSLGMNVVPYEDDDEDDQSAVAAADAPNTLDGSALPAAWTNGADNDAVAKPEPGPANMEVDDNDEEEEQEDEDEEEEEEEQEEDDDEE